MSIWDEPVSHGSLLKKAWKHLDLGVIQRKHPFHTPVFATTNGECASVRTVILRRFWRKPAALAFHAHTGSPKLEQIRLNPRVGWHFYHPEEKIQLRIKGIAVVHVDDDLANEQWSATQLFSRRCYVGGAPSAVSKKPSHGMPEDLADREPTREESEMGRANFCVISTSIEYIDFLELDVRGHRRSFFSWDGSGNLETGWLTP